MPPRPRATARPETLDTFTATVEQFLERAVVVMFASQADLDLRTGLHNLLAADQDRRPQRGIELIGDYLEPSNRPTASAPTSTSAPRPSSW